MKQLYEEVHNRKKTTSSRWFLCGPCLVLIYRGVTEGRSDRLIRIPLKGRILLGKFSQQDRVTSIVLYSLAGLALASWMIF